MMQIGVNHSSTSIHSSKNTALIFYSQTTIEFDSQTQRSEDKTLEKIQ